MPIIHIVGREALRGVRKMTIRWICEKCGKVVAYVDPQVQVQEAIDNPEQFCECPEEGGQ
jgi:hypothetical protein